MNKLLNLVALTVLTLPAQYTAQYLPTPTSGQPPGGTSPYALNNKGQVFGRNFWGGPGVNRGPVLWTNALPVALPVPAGYHWYDSSLNFLNDAGVALSLGQLDSATQGQSPTNAGIRPIVWQTGIATILPLPLSLSDCGSRFNNFLPPYTEERFNVWPVGLNRAGHVLLYACNSLWVVDSNGAVVIAG